MKNDNIVNSGSKNHCEPRCSIVQLSWLLARH